MFSLKTETGQDEKSFHILFKHSSRTNNQFLNLTLKWKENPSKKSVKLLNREPDNTTIIVNYDYSCDEHPVSKDRGTDSFTLTYLSADTWTFNQSSANNVHNFTFMVQNLELLNYPKFCPFDSAELERINDSVVLYSKVSSKSFSFSIFFYLYRCFSYLSQSLRHSTSPSQSLPLSTFLFLSLPISTSLYLSLPVSA